MTLVNAVQGPTPWRKVRTSIPALSSVNVDVLPLVSFRNANYFLAFSNLANSRFKSFEMRALNLNSQLSDTIINKLSQGSMMIETSMKVDGSNAVLEVVNNESFDIEVEFIRGVLNV